MCGICGEVRFDGREASPEAVARMNAVLEPRGPDGSGMVCRSEVALGQRRLKIIDLSDAAAQPMVDSELGLTIVYNGAIYNYKELRSELVDRGYRFFSTGDTEVILKAYHAWGKDCVRRLNGMFAFAVHERDSGRVLLARDRLGIKPMYYTVRPDRFRFASTLPALVASGNVGGEIDPVAFHHYMSFHSVVPAPHTMLRDVRKLPPGTTMTVTAAGAGSPERYWSLDMTPHPEAAHLSLEDWKAQLHDALRTSIQRRLTADVPVGVLLSGGLDSSLVVGLLAEAGQQNISTFSIGFEDVGDEKGSEFEYSDIIAAEYATDHHRIEVDSSRSLPSLERCVRSMSEPMVSHDCIGFYLLSEEVAKHVKVVQSGQGADEIFAGYHWYPPLLDSTDAVADYRDVFFDRTHEEFAMEVDVRFVHEDFSGEFVAQRFGRQAGWRAVDRALHLDTTVMLIDDPVKRVDNMTMAWGLEARVPFLDHELVEFAARIPAELKVAQGGKHILKETARDVIPHQVIDRPKGYFPVPALKYLRGDYLQFVRDIVNEPAARERRLFNRDYVDTLLADPEAHITRLRGSKLWQVALLEYWFQVNNL